MMSNKHISVLNTKSAHTNLHLRLTKQMHASQMQNAKHSRIPQRGAIRIEHRARNVESDHLSAPASRQSELLLLLLLLMQLLLVVHAARRLILVHQPAVHSAGAARNAIVIAIRVAAAETEAADLRHGKHGFARDGQGLAAKTSRTGRCCRASIRAIIGAQRSIGEDNALTAQLPLGLGQLPLVCGATLGALLLHARLLLLLAIGGRRGGGRSAQCTVLRLRQRMQNEIEMEANVT
jgi:hypothetical protein